MGRIYNIALDSNFNYNTGTSMSNYAYYINWESVMPQGSYLMKWSFQSIAIVAFDDDPSIGLSLPLGGNGYFSSKNLTSSGSSQFVGFLSTKDIGTGHYLFCDQKTNPPIYLQQRPNQNEFTVAICNGIDANSLYVSPIPVSYVLIMSFESVDY